MTSLMQRYEMSLAHLQALGWQVIGKDVDNQTRTGPAPRAELQKPLGVEVLWASLQVFDSTQSTALHIHLKVGVSKHDAICKAIFQTDEFHLLISETVRSTSAQLDHPFFVRLDHTCTEVGAHFEGIITLQNLTQNDYARRHQPGEYIAALAYCGEIDELEAYYAETKAGGMDNCPISEGCFVRALEIAQHERDFCLREAGDS